jgi:hypothetical protein
LTSLNTVANTSLGSNALFIDALNVRLGVNTTSPSVAVHINTVDAIFIPSGNTGQRPAGANGMMRYNAELDKFEGFYGGSWTTIGGISGAYYKGNAGIVGDESSKGNLYRINSNTQSNNITIAAGENALTAGPMVIQDGYNLTIETGGRVVIV